jgi:hypothetical protein
MSVFTSIYTRALPLNIYSNQVDIPYPFVVASGTITTISVDLLIDTTADFSGIKVGDTVWCITAGSAATVVAVINNTTLQLTDIGSWAGGYDYKVYQGANNGCYIFVPTQPDINFQLEVETIGGDIVTFNSPPAGVLPVQVRKVLDSTNAFKLVALW